MLPAKLHPQATGPVLPGQAPGGGGGRRSGGDSAQGTARQAAAAWVSPLAPGAVVPAGVRAEPGRPLLAAAEGVLRGSEGVGGGHPAVRGS